MTAFYAPRGLCDSHATGDGGLWKPERATGNPPTVRPRICGLSSVASTFTRSSSSSTTGSGGTPAILLEPDDKERSTVNEQQPQPVTEPPDALVKEPHQASRSSGRSAPGQRANNKSRRGQHPPRPWCDAPFATLGATLMRLDGESRASGAPVAHANKHPDANHDEPDDALDASLLLAKKEGAP